MSLITTQFGGLSSFDFSDKISFAESMISSIAILYWDDALYAPIYYTYYGIIFAMIVSFASAAFVAVKTVIAAIHTTRGFYFIYANYSSVANNMFLYEALVVLAFLFWSFLVILFAFLSGGHIWSLTNARLAEASADSLGIETPISAVKGIKNLVLCMVVALAVAISGYTLGENAVELISYFDHYDDNMIYYDLEGAGF